MYDCDDRKQLQELLEFVNDEVFIIIKDSRGPMPPPLYFVVDVTPLLYTEDGEGGL